MATEYKLSYTGAQIDEKLGKIDNLSMSVNNLSEEIDELKEANIGAQKKITGTAGQFVVIGDDGNVTTRTFFNAEEVIF